MVITDTQFYEGKNHSYADFPLADLIQMVGRANRPLEDEDAVCVLMCQTTKKDTYKKVSLVCVTERSTASY